MAVGIKNLEFKAGEAQAILVEAEGGDITLLPGEGGAVKAELAGDYFPDKCDITAEVKDGRLFLKAAARKKWFKKNDACKTGFKVYAPAGTKLVSKTGAGNVEIGAFSAGAEISVGAGNVGLAGLSGPIKISVGAGNVNGEIYSEDLLCRTGVGTLKLSWKTAPKAGRASVNAGTGAIALFFPAESRLAIKNSNGMGGFRSEIESDPSAAFRLAVNNGLGTASIKKTI